MNSFGTGAIVGDVDGDNVGCSVGLLVGDDVIIS